VQGCDGDRHTEPHGTTVTRCGSDFSGTVCHVIEQRARVCERSSNLKGRPFIDETVPMSSHRKWLGAVVIFAGFTLAACGGASTTHQTSEGSPSPTTRATVPPAPTTGSTPAKSNALALSGSEIASATANQALTPGVTDPAVTQSNIHQTICTRGYTSTVRNVSTKTKSAVYAEYHVAPGAKRGYVIDHLVPLEVGGANDIRNLWPEAKAGAERKDQTENLLHARVCNDTVALAAAQQVFEAAWSPRDITTAPVAPEPVTQGQTPGNGATAVCRDGSYSFAANHSGACSRHGGVAHFYK
jgi:hypothetical protein